MLSVLQENTLTGVGIRMFRTSLVPLACCVMQNSNLRLFVSVAKFMLVCLMYSEAKKSKFWTLERRNVLCRARQEQVVCIQRP